MIWRFRIRILTASVCLLSLVAAAQQGPPTGGGMSSGTASIIIRLESESGPGLVDGVRVELLSEFGQMADVRTTDGTGTAIFRSLPLGRYKVRVSGVRVETKESNFIDVSTPGPAYTEHVSVRSLKADDRSANGTGELRPIVDLNVPDKAKKELDKGVSDVQHKNWTSAKDHFERAITIYPKYALAYNNLALALLNVGEAEKAIESFRTALQYDEHLQQANLYLGRFYYENKKFKEAEPYLTRAAADQPGDPQLLTVLANTEMRNGEADQALLTAQKVHSLPNHGKNAVAHLIAGDILLSKDQNAGAAEEYKRFLAEDPTSPLAPRVREALAKLQLAGKK